MAVKKKSVGARLNRMIDGHLKSKAEVKRALKRVEGLAAEIADIEERFGLPAMRAEAVALKKAATDYMVENEIETLELDKTGKYARLIQSAHHRRWVLRASEFDGVSPPEGFRSLRGILLGKFGVGTQNFKTAWKTATKQVPDPEGIQLLVAENFITEKELEPAYVEEEKAPYLRVFGKGEDES